MKKSKWIYTIVIVMLTIYSGIGQNNIVKYDFKKGEVLDILLLNKKTTSDSLMKIYFQKAFPISTKNGYKPNKGFTINEGPFQGNYHPEFMIVASWSSEEDRDRCLVELNSEVDDFHKMRRDIWSHFNVAYYTLSEDLNFQVDRDKYNVVTAYWQKDKEDMTSFISEWKAQVEQSGGAVIIQLTDPKSTFGYVYTPEYYILTTWESKKDFEHFKQENLKMDHSSLEQVHQFRIQ